MKIIFRKKKKLTFRKVIILADKLGKSIGSTETIISKTLQE